jgi:predicted RND superfamily exporter protein
MGFLGVPMTQVTVVLPVLMLSVGSAYGIHIMHRYYEERASGLPVRDAVGRTIEFVGIPILLAGVTTAAGFGANGFSSIPRIREFGLLAAFGVGCALAISLLFIPSGLVLSRRAARSLASGRDSEPMPASFGRVGRFVARRRWLAAGLTFAVVAVSVAGLPRLRIDTNFLSFFPEASAPRQAFEVVRSKFGGVDTIQIVLEGDVLEPRTLRAMDRAQQEFERTPGFGRAISVVDIVKQTSVAVNGNDPAFERIPDTKEAVAQYLLLVSMSGDVALEQMLTMDNRRARIQVMVDAADSTRRQDVLRRARDIVSKT